MQQLLNKLDSQLCETIKTVQDIIMKSPLRDKWETLGTDADAIYQRMVKELYEMVKGWSTDDKCDYFNQLLNNPEIKQVSSIEEYKQEMERRKNNE